MVEGEGEAKPEKIDVFGVKIDIFNAVIGILASGAALGTGYLLYKDFESRTAAENARKAQIEAAKQAQYYSYMQEQAAARQRTNLANRPSHSPPPQDETIASRIDMNYLQPPAPEQQRKLSYQEILAQSEMANPNNPTAYNINSPMIDYNATFPSRSTPPPSPSPSQSLINMSLLKPSETSQPYYEGGEGEGEGGGEEQPQQQPPEPPMPTERKQQEGQEQQLDELYKSMGNY